MNRCKKYEKLLEKALNNELNNSEATLLNKHLSSCNKCSTELEELKSTVELVKTRKRTEPEEIFMNNFWNMIETKLETDAPSSLLSKKINQLSTWWTGFVNSLQFGFYWKYGLTGVMILFIGIFIGKFLSSGDEKAIQDNLSHKNTLPATQSALKIETSYYIERSKVLLLGMMNFNPAIDDVETISLSHQKKISRELLTKAVELKEDLKDPQLKNLIADIELILLQIANLELNHDLTGIELIQEGVDRRGIILKINIQEMQDNNEKYNEQSNTKNESKNI